MKLRFLKKRRISLEGHDVVELKEGDVADVERGNLAKFLIEEGIAEDVSDSFKPLQEKDLGPIQDFTELVHIGKVTAKKIVEKGIRTFNDLADFLEENADNYKWFEDTVSGPIEEVIEDLNSRLEDEE